MTLRSLAATGLAWILLPVILCAGVGMATAQPAGQDPARGEPAAENEPAAQVESPGEAEAAGEAETTLKSDAAAPPAGEDTAPILAAGEIIAKLAAEEDPTQTYALYLPSGFRRDRKWPVLLLMDPRGRALIPLERFRPVAEDLGYVVVSSYDTASDGPRAPNIVAMRALLPEIDRRLSPAPGRLYLSGFSGTARFGWDIGALMGDQVAGLIGVGAGRPPTYAPSSPATFAFFGVAGVTDFNYEELRVLDQELDGSGQPHRFASFDGTHEWPPEEVCTAALQWMELQAMRRGLRPRSDSLVTRLHDEAVARAVQMGKWPVLAAEAWSAIAEDFEGLTDVTDATARAERLAAGKEVQAARRQEEAMIHERNVYQARFSAWLQQVDGAPNPPLTSRSLSTLEIARLKRRQESRDRFDGEAARRILGHVYSYTAFYETRRYLEEDRPDQALAMLAIADAIHPDSPRVCLGQARAYARLGQQKKGLEALKCLMKSGAVGADFVAGDLDLAPLRSGEDYEALMKKWETAAP